MKTYGFNGDNQYGFNSPQGFGFVSSTTFTNCFTSLTNSGTIWGYDAGVPFGAITPDTTSDGSTIYAYNFDTSDGTFRLEIGATGIDQLTNTSLVLFDHSIGNVELFWDETASAYLGTNQALATSLSALTGTEVCFSSIVVPELLIHYTFEEIVYE